MVFLQTDVHFNNILGHLFQVWHIGICRSCSLRANESKYGKAVLFLEHVASVARYLKETHPHLKIIMWDDMLRTIDETTLHGKTI